MRPTLAIVLLTTALTALPHLGCTPLQTPFETPEKTARDFHKHLLFGDCKSAFALLDEATQNRLKDMAQRTAQVAGGLTDKAEIMICQGDGALYKSRQLSGDDVVQVRRVTSESSAQEDVEATILVTIDGEDWPTHLRKNAEGKWRIDLTKRLDEHLKKAAQEKEIAQKKSQEE